MKRCEACGNEYESLFEVRMPDDNQIHFFDSFECASHVLAPECEGCGVKILGHGVEVASQTYCSAHCARKNGSKGVVDHAYSENEMGY